MSDRFLKLQLDFKENSKTRYNGNKKLQNLANFGGEIGTKLFVDRNGEYNGIVIELQEKVYPLFLDETVHSIYLNIESNYSSNILLIERFGLTELFQKYSNEIFRFIVDQFLILNNVQPFYSDYPKIISNIKSPEIIQLKKIICIDIHTLIPCKIKVVSCGELLPEDWVGKVFGSGESFHRAIDLLEARINKPPVTYLANYCMMHFKVNKLLQTKDLKNIDLVYNIWVQDLVTGKFISSRSKNKIDISNLPNYVQIDCMEEPIYILFSSQDTFNHEIKQLEFNSIGFNVSLMQKSFRRGPEVVDNLKEAITKLSITKPYNNPEHQYELTSGSKQLFWRYFISIIEDIQIYQSTLYFDIFDLVIYAYIFGQYPEYVLNKKLSNKLIELGEKLLEIKSYVDFRKYNEDISDKFNLFCRYQVSLGIGLKHMKGMQGDKKMIKKLLTFIKSNPKLVLIDSINPTLKEDLIYKKIGWYSSLDLHTNPQMIVQFQNAIYKKDKEPVDLETCSKLIWNYSSSYNIRIHPKFKFNKLNDLLYLIQFTWFNDVTKSDFKLELSEDFDNKLWGHEFRLIDNLTKLKYQSLTCKIIYNNLNYKSFNSKNLITKNQIGQILLSSQNKNYFWTKGKKTFPILTNDQIKFKYKDEIIDKESDDYEKIFLEYTKHLNDFSTTIINELCNLKIKTNYKDRWIHINNIKCVEIKEDYSIEYSENLYELLNKKENIFKTQLPNSILETIIDELISCSTDEISTYINYKTISSLQNSPNQIIQTKLINLIPSNVKQIILSRVLTSLEDKMERTILILCSINRLGKSNGDSVDGQFEGYLLRLFSIFAVLYGCFQRVTEYKYVIDIKSKIFRIWLKDMGYHIESCLKPESIKKIKIVKTRLWEHQVKVRDMISNGIIKYNQRGFGDASEVGSGKTLTAISCIEFLFNLNKDTNKESNYLILVPNTNLYQVWKDEISSHCENTICYLQESDGKWTKIIGENLNKSYPALWISTMGRNRDHQFELPIDFVIIDECLSVQNKESKWTMKAFEQVVRAKYGVLMLSATFFRTRFDKLFFMLKMLCTGLPTKSEYLDTILNTAIGANIKINRIKWDITVHKIKLDDKFYEGYKQSKVTDKFESYIRLKKYLSNNINFEKIAYEKINHLLKEKRKILFYVESDSQQETFIKYVQDNKLVWGFYPDISKDVCIISKHKGTYGINNLVKYDTIVMKPPEPDKLPQIKGRLDRPNQKALKLYLEYLVIADTIEEIDIVKLELANGFYQGHIIPLANYYDKYC